MTVQVNTDGPSVDAWGSTKYAATVNATSAWVYGHEQTVLMNCAIWDAGDAIEESWFTFGTDEITTVVISLLSGSITSARVYSNQVIEQVVAGGTLTLTMPVDSSCRVEVNDDQAEALHIGAWPLSVIPAVGARTDWTTLGKTVSAVSLTSNGELTVTAHGFGEPGDEIQCLLVSAASDLPVVSAGSLSRYEQSTASVVDANTLTLTDVDDVLITYTDAGTSLKVYPATWTDTTKVLYFPAGEHVIPRRLHLETDTKVHLGAGAVVDGSWDVVLSDRVQWAGLGMSVGFYASTLSIGALGSVWDKMKYSLFHGLEQDTAQCRDSTVVGITCACYPFYVADRAAYKWTNVMLINPWSWTTDGFRFCKTTIEGENPGIVNCYAYIGDDCVNLIPDQDVRTASGSFLSTSTNSCFQIGYWPSVWSSTGSPGVRDCTAMHVGAADSGSYDTVHRIGHDAILKCLVDGHPEESAYGVFNGVVDGLRIVGPLSCRAIVLGNVGYPFEQQNRRSQYGQMNGWTFSNISIENVGQPSLIIGRDALNTPHDISFTAITVAGEPIYDTNFETLFEINSFPYNITWDAEPGVIVEPEEVVVATDAEELHTAMLESPDVLSYTTATGASVTRRSVDEMMKLDRYLRAKEARARGRRQTRVRFR